MKLIPEPESPFRWFLGLPRLTTSYVLVDLPSPFAFVKLVRLWTASDDAIFRDDHFEPEEPHSFNTDFLSTT